MSRSSRIGAVRKELMTLHPNLKFYVPYVFGREYNRKERVPICPNCQRQCFHGIVKAMDDMKMATDVLVCSACEHMSIYKERAA